MSQITLKQAYDALQQFQADNPHPSRDQIVSEVRRIADQLSVDAGSSRTTTLYSGRVGEDSAGNIANRLPETDYRILDKTDAGDFLFSEEVDRAYKSALPTRPNPTTGRPEFTPDAWRRISLDPESPNGATSRRFAEGAVGTVLFLGPNADIARVGGAIELPAVLNNPDVTAVNGIPRDHLRSLPAYAQAFEQIKDASQGVIDRLPGRGRDAAAPGLARGDAASGTGSERPTLHVVAGADAADRAALIADGRFSDAVMVGGTEAGQAGAGRTTPGPGRSAVVETTLSGPSTQRLMDQARQAGVRVELHYLAGGSADRAAAAAALPEAIAQADRTTLHDTAGDTPREVASLSRDAYRFAQDAPSWATGAAYQAATRDHAQARTPAEMNRAFARATEAAAARGADPATVREVRQAGLGHAPPAEPPTRSRPARDVGHGL